MNQLIQFNDKNRKGGKILSENIFFKDLCNLMKNVEFVKFYDNYFKDWSDIQCMIFYMKLYSTIEYEYKLRFNSEINDETMTLMMHKIMTNGQTRKFAFDVFEKYKNDYNHESSEGFRKELQF
jgi:hypothetical protein